MLDLRILKNEEINDDLLKRIEMFDKKIFSGSDYSFPEGYLSSLYSTNKEAMFVLLNGENVVGYVNALFMNDEDFQKYLKDPNYLNLKNIGLHDGDNNMYFYTVAIDETLRHTSAVKFLMYEFCHWLAEMRLKGRRVSQFVTEVISDDGLRTSKIMGLVPLNGGERDFGLYYSPDNILHYIKKMLEENANIKDFQKLVDTLKNSDNFLNKFSTKKEAVEYLVSKTKKSKSECELAYDFIKDLKLSNYDGVLDREREKEFVTKIVELAKFYKLPVFAVTDGLTTYYNDTNSDEVRNARDNYLHFCEQDLLKEDE